MVLPDGSQHKFQFYERESEHISHTPQAQTALVKFAAMHLDVEALALRDLSRTTTEGPAARAQGSKQITAPASSRKAPTMTERIHALLAEEPGLSITELEARIGCSLGLAQEARRSYFVQHPEQRAVAARAKAPTITERVRALLAEEPALSALELAERTGCSERHAMNVRRRYFVQHPEQKAALPVHLTAGACIEALLAEEPALPTGEVAARIGCCRSLVTRVRAVLCSTP